MSYILFMHKIWLFALFLIPGTAFGGPVCWPFLVDSESVNIQELEQSASSGSRQVILMGKTKEAEEILAQYQSRLKNISIHKLEPNKPLLTKIGIARTALHAISPVLYVTVPFASFVLPAGAESAPYWILYSTFANTASLMLDYHIGARFKPSEDEDWFKRIFSYHYGVDTLPERNLAQQISNLPAQQTALILLDKRHLDGVAARLIRDHGFHFKSAK